MSILTNWIFWVIIAFIVFILAIIGYLSESRKRSSENDISSDETNNVSNLNVSQKEVQADSNTSLSESDFNVMPEINSTTVSKSSDIISNSNLGSDVFSVPPTLSGSPVMESTLAINTPAAPVAEMPVSPTTVAEAPVVTSVESAPAVNVVVSPVEPAPVVSATPAAPVAEAPVTTSVESAPAVNVVASPVEPASVVSATPVINTPAAPVEPLQNVNNSSVMEPSSIFTANIGQEVSSMPTPIPAEPIPSVIPEPIPSVNAEVNPENISTNTNDDIETL